MRTFNTQKEIDSALDERGSLIIDDNVTFNCDVKISGNINAWNINAGNINAVDINAVDIKAWNINAENISFYAICVSYASFRCKFAVGRRDNAKAICLDSEIVYTADTAVKGGKE